MGEVEELLTRFANKHEHTIREHTARASQVTPVIGNNAIRPNNIAPSAVTTSKIADAAVTTVKLASGAVTAEILADGAVSSKKIAPGTITVDVIGSGASASNQANKLIKRDNDGSFAANFITANGLTGTAGAAVYAHTTSGSAGAALYFGGIHRSKISSNKVANSLVRRDDNGGFKAGDVILYGDLTVTGSPT
ncbi:hypothetical protein EBZ39_14840, partial [bacterium]|nr:hypothetical protein [bacterium]